MRRRARIILFALVLGLFWGPGARAQSAAALHQAAQANDGPAVTRLIKLGAALEARDVRGRTPLMVATHANAVAVARALIAAGANVNARDAIMDTPYLYAGAEGRLEILKMTLRSGADLNSTNRYGGTALTPAAHHGHIGVVRLLAATKVPIDQINNLGWTALMEAVVLGDGSDTYRQIVDILIRAGADVNIRDGQGVSALTHAGRRGFKSISAVLEKAGGRP